MRHNTSQSSSTASPTLFGYQGQQLFFLATFPNSNPTTQSPHQSGLGGGQTFSGNLFDFTPLGGGFKDLLFSTRSLRK